MASSRSLLSPSLAFVASILINDPNQCRAVYLSYAVQNAASFAEGAVAPGESCHAARQRGLVPQTGVNAQPGPSRISHGNFRAWKYCSAGRPAPLLYVQSEQINAMVPWETGSGSPNPGTTVEVKYNGASISSPVLLNQASPGIFLSNYEHHTVRVGSERGRYAEFAYESGKTRNRGDILRYRRRTHEAGGSGWGSLALQAFGESNAFP